MTATTTEVTEKKTTKKKVVAKKAAAKKAAPKKEAKTPEVVDGENYVEVGDERMTFDGLRTHVVNTYHKMQLSWFDFARSVYAIHESQSFLEYGYDSFREYALNEFRELDYTVVLKCVHVYREFGKMIEEKLSKTPNTVLPNYNSFYVLGTAKKKLPTPEITKLKKDLLDGKLSYNAMRAEIKERTDEILSEEKAKLEKAGKEIEAKEDELYKDIKDKKLPEEKKTSDTDASLFLDEEGLGEEESGKAARLTLGRLKTHMANVLKGGKVDDEVVAFGNELEEFTETIEKFLNGLEKL